MLSHEQIWKAIDRLADAHNYSTSGLARRAGLDPTTFNRSKRFSGDGKERWPSTESISKILAVTEATLSQFIALVDDGKGAAGAPDQARRFIPLIPMAQASKDGLFDEKGFPTGRGWDEIQFPNTQNSEQSALYALEISDESMSPVYRTGDIVIVAPGLSPRRGDRVIIRTTKGEILARELARQTATRIDLKSYHPAVTEVEIAADSVVWMARILWVSQSL